jgi:hypothetical protein
MASSIDNDRAGRGSFKIFNATESWSSAQAAGLCGFVRC